MKATTSCPSPPPTLSLVPIFIGLRQALEIGWIALFVAELQTTSQGLGFIMNDAKEHLRTDPIFVVLVIYALLGIVTDSLVRNVVLGLAGSKSSLRQAALETLAEVDLATKADVWPGTLSGGQAQRVALARALVREPLLVHGWVNFHHLW